MTPNQPNAPMEGLREEFNKEFPNLKWETTGGTGDIFAFFTSLIPALLKEAEERLLENVHTMISNEVMTMCSRHQKFDEMCSICTGTSQLDASEILTKLLSLTEPSK